MVQIDYCADGADRTAARARVQHSADIVDPQQTARIDVDIRRSTAFFVLAAIKRKKNRTACFHCFDFIILSPVLIPLWYYYLLFQFFLFFIAFDLGYS